MARTSPGTRALRRQATAAGLALIIACAVAAPASAGTDYEQTVDLTFPVAGTVWFTNDYAAYRGGGTRRHQATDLYAAKGTPVHAAVGGTVCQLSGASGPEPSYGYVISICSPDGRKYDYVHMNNDTPGTDDGLGGPAAAYAPGLAMYQSVRRGQLIGFLGDSGNAEDTPPHLHFEIEDPTLRDPRLEPDPWITDRINPYSSLLAARERGDVPGAAGRLLQLEDPYLRGEDVRSLQQGLTELGYRLAVDGIFGRGTDRAARAFQERVGLVPTGPVGPKTLAALERARAEGETVVRAEPASSTWPGRHLELTQPYLRGDDVRTFQQRLAQLGYSDAAGGALVDDGVWGPSTDRAARAFIADAGLPDIAIVGPRTWAAAFGG